VLSSSRLEIELLAAASNCTESAGEIAHLGLVPAGVPAFMTDSDFAE
jgi:hypothetical protein